MRAGIRQQSHNVHRTQATAVIISICMLPPPEQALEPAIINFPMAQIYFHPWRWYIYGLACDLILLRFENATNVQPNRIMGAAHTHTAVYQRHNSIIDLICRCQCEKWSPDWEAA